MKKFILGFIVGALLFGAIPIYAATNGVDYGDMSFFDSGVKVLEFYNNLGGNGYSIRPRNNASLFLGGEGLETYADGIWDFSNVDTIKGVETNNCPTMEHNHGIPDGTMLLTKNGTVTFHASGGFPHKHAVQKSE